MLMHTCSRVMVAADSVDVVELVLGFRLPNIFGVHGKRVRAFLAFAF